MVRGRRCARKAGLDRRRRGDGAVGLMGVLPAQQIGAERSIAMSRHKSRQELAVVFGATDIVAERGDEGASRVKELTKGVGADSVLECVGTAEAMKQSLACVRPADPSASSAFRTMFRSTARRYFEARRVSKAALLPSVVSCNT